MFMYTTFSLLNEKLSPTLGNNPSVPDGPYIMSRETVLPNTYLRGLVYVCFPATYIISHSSFFLYFKESAVTMTINAFLYCSTIYSQQRVQT